MALADYVLQQRLSMVVPARLEALGLAKIARALEQRVAARRERAVVDAKVQCVLTDGVLRRLEGVGIPAVGLKGVDLSERLYGNSASRESRDIDVLVLPQHLDLAAKLAENEFGYAPPVGALGCDGRPLLHYRLEHPNGWPSLELHWRVHWYEPDSGAEMVRESAKKEGLRAMKPSHELASLLLFYARNGFVGIRDLAAIAAWWDRYQSDLPPSGLAGFAHYFPELAPALATSAGIANQMAGLPLAPLRLDARPATLRERRAGQLANPQPASDTSRLLADISLVDLLLAPRPGLKDFARRQMLLDASYQQSVSGVVGRKGRRLGFDRPLARAGRMARALATGRPVGLEAG